MPPHATGREYRYASTPASVQGYAVTRTVILWSGGIPPHANAFGGWVGSWPSVSRLEIWLACRCAIKMSSEIADGRFGVRDRMREMRYNALLTRSSASKHAFSRQKIRFFSSVQVYRHTQRPNSCEKLRNSPIIQAFGESGGMPPHGFCVWGYAFPQISALNRQ